MNALILVDLQNDFMPGGALPVPHGDQVIEVANRLMASFPIVAATQDWHPPDHGSFASQHVGKQIGELHELDGLPQIMWPDHCVQNSQGAEFVPSLNRDAIDRIVVKGGDRSVDSYSGFFDNGRRRETELRSYLQANRVHANYIMGVATDYCVKFTALDSIDLGFETFLILDGCRGVELNEGDVAKAVDELLEAGVRVVDSRSILASSKDDADSSRKA